MLSNLSCIINHEDIAQIKLKPNHALLTFDNFTGLFDSDHMDYHLLSNTSHNPTLAEMTRKAIKILRKNPKGYVLFVEGGRIDHAHHDTKSQLSLDETVEMDKAIEEASKLTRKEDTLTVVTADHAHTFSIAGYPVRGNPIFGVAGTSDVDSKKYTSLSYANGPGYKQPTATGERYNILMDNTGKYRALDYTFMATAPLTSETHGADDVAVYSKGPWAHLFTGTYEQNFIMHAMCYALRIGPASHWSHSH
ncbi:hypothetical protein J437_LFUL014439 [Ladona fulva]|uniref:alkaline phosphatase n=1 Tax=Ladona fulva TaxID=123851 RepID=A0A8K0KCW8_LADFU|nr:hypothetical protein J437_LFUL014439 [Ladona fulva]